MQWARQLSRTPGIFRCLGNTALKRPYSFANEIESVLAAFNVDVDRPTSSPASAAALASFHQKVISARTQTSDLISEYESFQRHRSVRALPLLTCKLFLRRLLADLHIGVAAQLLLTYDLNDTVNVVVELIEEQGLEEQRTSLVMLCAELRRLSQHGMAKQICTALGYSPSAMSHLLDLHQGRFSFRELHQVSEQLFRESILDGWTVYVLCKRFMSSNLQEEALKLIRIYPKAAHAVHYMIERLAPTSAANLFCELAGNEGNSFPIQTWKKAAVACDYAQFQTLAGFASSPSVQFELAKTAAENSSTVSISYELATLLAQSDYAATDLGKLASDWFTLQASTLDSEKLAQALRQLVESLTPHGDQTLSDFLSAFADTLSNASTAAILTVLKQIEFTDYAVPFHVERKLSRHTVQMSAKDTALYCSMRKTSLRAMHAIVSHHLGQYRLSLQDGKFFACLLDDLQRLQVNADVIQDLYHLCIQDLIRLRPPTLALSLLSSSNTLHLSPDLPNTAGLIRSLTRNGYYDVVLHLLEASVPVPGTGMSHAARIQRNIFARFLLHTASREPRVAMQTLYYMRGKGFTPSAYLLESMALRLVRYKRAPGSRTTTSNATLFRFLTKIIRLSAELGYKTSTGPGFASSLVRLVLMRQGLGASKQRIAYTLGRSSRAFKQEDFEELMSILKRWRSLTDKEAVMSRGQRSRLARQRPRELRQLLDRVDERRQRPSGRTALPRRRSRAIAFVRK